MGSAQAPSATPPMGQLKRWACVFRHLLLLARASWVAVTSQSAGVSSTAGGHSPRGQGPALVAPFTLSGLQKAHLHIQPRRGTGLQHMRRRGRSAHSLWVSPGCKGIQSD